MNFRLLHQKKMVFITKNIILKGSKSHLLNKKRMIFKVFEFYFTISLIYKKLIYQNLLLKWLLEKRFPIYKRKKH